MSDWRDQFSEPRVGYCPLVVMSHGEVRVIKHRYLSDFGFVHLVDRPKADDEVKIRAFAKSKWEAGEDAPFLWVGEL